MGNVLAWFCRCCGCCGCCGRSSNTEIPEPNNPESTSNTQRLQNEEECRHDPDAPGASNVNDDQVLDEETIESLEKLRKEMESPTFDRRLVIERLHNLMKNLQEMKSSNTPLIEQQSSFDNMVKKPINYVVEKWAVIKKTGVPQKMAKLTASVLEKVGQTGFILVGLSFIGSMLNQATEVPSTAESCIKFLKSIRCLLAILNSDICSHGLHVLQGSPLNSVIDEITNGIIVCCSYARAGFPTQFLQVEGVKVDLVEISDSLYKAIQILKLEVQFANLEVALETLKEVKSLKRQRTQVITHNENIKDTDKVGIDDRVAEVKMLLQMDHHEEKGVAVILHGPGGMGKTTVASNVINALKPSSAHFSYASVTLDSNRQDFETQVKDLQSELISQLKGSKSEVRNVLAGRQELQTHFSSHSCFIFVDNVVDSHQLDGLFPDEIPTNHTLRILVTSRDVDVRKNIPFDINHIKLYPIDRLRDEPSLVLLKKTVDTRDGIEQFRGETQKLGQIAKLCYGIPLLLIQVGKDLKFQRQEYYYNDTLKRLEEADFSTYRSKTLDEFLLCIFKLLEKDVQTAFLDICEFFVENEDWQWEMVCDIVGEKAMHILAERSMIQKGDHPYLSWKIVIVHDVLKAMALKITKEQRSHFIIPVDPEKIGSESVKLSDLFEEHVDATDIEGLFINNLHSSSNIHVQLGNLPSLRIFKATFGISVEFKEEKGQPSSFDNLCYFSIRQKTQRDVMDLLLKERKSILPLKVLSLRDCEDVEEFPKHLGMIQQLRVLKILASDKLKSVPLDIQHLQFLEVLEFSYCNSIESLPEELGQLHSLKSLRLSECEKFRTLPSTISNLSCLTDLDMSWCRSLVSLPDDMWKLASLERLDLSFCLNLVGLPSHVEGLVSLKSLNLRFCTKIERLPEQLGKLHALEDLDLWRCDSLQCLPQSISELQSLKVLNIGDCESITCLPEDICKLGSLKALHMAGCKRITCLPEDICKLGSLEKLDLRGCHNLQLTSSQREWMATLKDFTE